MPKIVDHTAQRQRIADAALELIGSKGLEHTTVRAIASQAGMSVGSMRHYIATQDDLFVFAMELFSERFKARVAALAPEGSLIERLQAVLEQLLPLDDERRLETEVWLAFVVRAQNKPKLKATLKEMNEAILWHIEIVLDILIATGYFREGVQKEVEGERLLALINGLAINAILWFETTTPDKMRALLRSHLLSITVEP